MTPEGKIQSKIIKFLEEQHGYECIKLIKTSKNGVPDLMVLKGDEKMFFVEVKTEKGRLSPLQKFRIKKLEENGYKVLVPYGYEDFIDKFYKLIYK